jgi:hypothetical protein
MKPSSFAHLVMRMVAVYLLVCVFAYNALHAANALAQILGWSPINDIAPAFTWLFLHLSSSVAAAVSGLFLWFRGRTIVPLFLPSGTAIECEIEPSAMRVGMTGMAPVTFYEGLQFLSYPHYTIYFGYGVFQLLAGVFLVLSLKTVTDLFRINWWRVLLDCRRRSLDRVD